MHLLAADRLNCLKRAAPLKREDLTFDQNSPILLPSGEAAERVILSKDDHEGGSSIQFFFRLPGKAGRAQFSLVAELDHQGAFNQCRAEILRYQSGERGEVEFFYTGDLLAQGGEPLELEEIFDQLIEEAAAARLQSRIRRPSASDIPALFMFKQSR